MDSAIQQLIAKDFRYTNWFGFIGESELSIVTLSAKPNQPFYSVKPNSLYLHIQNVETKALLERIDDRTKQHFQERISRQLI